MAEAWILRILLLLVFQSIVHGECFKRLDFKRDFYVNAENLTLKIEVGNGIAHQIVSNILRILLLEVVGYEDVELVHQGYDYSSVQDYGIRTLQTISNCTHPKDCKVPETFVPDVMINLEAWYPPGYDIESWVDTDQIVDCGSFGPIGRYGWYIPQYTIKYLWDSNGTICENWRAFKNPNVSQEFDLTINGVLENLVPRSTRTKHCNYKECDSNGIYRPIQCRSSDVHCATILADYPESTINSLKRKIDRHELLVNIVWLGSAFVKTIEELSKAKRNFLFVHQMPSYLSVIGNFSPVTFPLCENMEDPECEIEVYQMRKIAWSKIKSGAEEAMHVLRLISLSQDQYIDMLTKYRFEHVRGNDVSYFACLWLKSHEFMVQKWAPNDNKTSLYIGGIFPMTGTYWRQKGVTIAAHMAAKAVNANASILHNYHLEILEQDGHCAADEVMKSFIKYVTNTTYARMVGILGPACSDTVEPVAGVAKHFSTIIISYSAEGALFSNREKYPYFFRTIPENNLFRYVYMKLFKRLGWKRVAALTEDGQKYPEYLSHLQDLMTADGMTFIVNRKFPRERKSLDMKPYLQELKSKDARIIIGDFYDNSARAIMCDAYKLKMTAAHGYQWFLPLWFTANWFNTDMHNSNTNTTYDHVSCTTEQMIEAINGHMSLAYKYYADSNQVMQEGNKTVGQWHAEYSKLAKQHNIDVSQYAGYTYDAVWVYATAVDTLLKENKSHISTLHSPKTSKRLVEILNETNMDGVSGQLSFMGSSRISDIILWQWVRNTTKKIGLYQAISQDEGNLRLDESDIKWFTANGQRPDDGSTDSDICSVESLRLLLGGVTCETAIIAANCIGFMLLFSALVASFAIYKRRYEMRMKRTEERMKELGLMTSCVPFALDEWEMPRDHIVINRKLGEGAFGTVFGGEAMIQTSGWIAVAVKTLKSGAKAEEKLDFLSEAEVMKQFDHRNIVKLIGVCTSGEPVYTIMEFMLYGDLKTYLLSRRDLAGEKDRTNNNEVSDRKLTSMALDIARGLSYLADLKFVHRDLACRNCLVNAARCVKIADFGMCRAMYDSDYYRYNKKGMLPVRWMAPESLIDGLFTPPSDVWSLGVVLYEIVTFASFPYQGLSNNQVLERIKNYERLPVPEGCKPELTGLLLRCWNRNPLARPHAAEIVEILANHPELISPSLDMPIASVEVEDSADLDISIHDRSRNHSFSYIWQSRRKAASIDITETSSPKLAKGGVEKAISISKHVAMATYPNRKLSFAYEVMMSGDSPKNYSEHVDIEDIPQVTYL